MSAAEPKLRNKNFRLMMILLIIVVLMFGFGYLMVPFYNVLCNVLGINGKTGSATVAANVSSIDKTRMITVQFIASNNANLPWKFYPLKTTVRVHPGANTKVAFFAENESGKTMTVQAIPSVTPGLAAVYLKKTECFCFAQQTLASKESMDMPLLFHIDRDIPKNINTVTLGYTLFNVTGKKKSVGSKKQGRLG